MATVTGTKIQTFTTIARAIAENHKALNKRIDHLAKEAISAANARANKPNCPETAKALDVEVTKLHHTLAAELTAAFKTLRADCAAAQKQAADEGAADVAASWDWHAGSEARRYRNAVGYVVRCTAQKTGLVIKFDRASDSYTVSIATPKNTGTMTSTPKVPAEIDGAIVATHQAAENASVKQEAASASDDAANGEKAAALLAAMIKTNREAVLLALAATYPDRDSMIEAVTMLPVGAFPAIGALTVMAG